MGKTGSGGVDGDGGRVVSEAACPHCGRVNRVPDWHRGVELTCGGCERVFRRPSATDDRSAGGPAAAAGVFAGEEVRSCPMCGHTFWMQPRLVGKAIRCRKCRREFRVLHSVERAPPSVGANHSPAPSPIHPDRAPEAVASGRDQPEPEAAPMPAAPLVYAGRRRSRPVPRFGELIAVIVGGILAFPVMNLICWWGLAWDPFGMASKLRPGWRWLAPPEFVAPDQALD